MHFRPPFLAQAAVSKENTRRSHFSGGLREPVEVTSFRTHLCIPQPVWRQESSVTALTPQLGRSPDHLTLQRGTLCLDWPGKTIATGCTLWTLPCFRRPKLGLMCVSRTHCSTCIHVTCYLYSGSSLLFGFQPTGPMKIITRHILNCHLFVRLSLAWLKTSFHPSALERDHELQPICKYVHQ